MKKLLLLSFALLLCCVSQAQKVSVDYDHSANFAEYRTYSWGEVKTIDSLWAGRIQDAINQQLQAKGWQQVSSGGEVVILALGQAHSQREEQTFYSGGGWFWGPGVATTTVYNTRQGLLVISMFDSKTKKLIWRGVSNGELSDKPEKNIGKLDKSVAKMFQKFPPHP